MSTSTRGIDHVAIVADDMPLAMDFYRFPFARRDDGPDSVAMHNDLTVGNPSALKPEIPYNSPDAIAERWAQKNFRDKQRQPVGIMYRDSSRSGVEVSWMA